ncbi:MAG: CopG family ribbon-helix-helix protein [Clostridia bacterium]
MAQSDTRVMVRLSQDLLEALDALGRDLNRPRSQLIRESVARYVEDSRRERIRQALIQGYEEWSQVNAQPTEDVWSPIARPGD